MSRAKTIGSIVSIGVFFILAASGGCGGKADQRAQARWETSQTKRTLTSCTVAPEVVSRDSEAVIFDGGYDPSWTVRVEVADAVGKTTIDLNPEPDGTIRVPYLTEAKGPATVQIGRLHNGQVHTRSKCKFEVLGPQEAQPRTNDEPSLESSALSQNTFATETVAQ